MTENRTRERITISSTDLQRGWRVAQTHLIRGLDVVVEHYNVPVAIITAYPTDDEVPPGPAPDEEDARDFCATADEAKNNIRVAIEASGAADADDYDIDAIFDEAYKWEIDANEQGQELLNSAGFVQVVDADEFWEIVGRHEK